MSYIRDLMVYTEYIVRNMHLVHALLCFVIYVCARILGLCQKVVVISRDHFVYAPSKWETTLQCNIFSHCLGAYTKWSLLKHQGISSHNTEYAPIHFQMFMDIAMLMLNV